MEGHQPVMLQEVVGALQPGPQKRFLDATFGRGGHTAALLDAGATVCAMDQDPEAIAGAEVLQKKWGAERFQIVRKNFRALGLGFEGEFDGILLDLGVSSPQFDRAERGFSFRFEGPLDMRMDPSQRLTADWIVNEYSEKELEMIFKEYGEEREGRRVARAIVKAREAAPLRTTLELAKVVERAIPFRRQTGLHPATRIFQALRIVVNDELNALREALAQVRSILREKGRLAVITFHSLEDRIVKQFIQHASEEELRQPGIPFGNPNPDYFLKKLKDIAPSEEEIKANPRARSARLRLAERVVYGA